MAPTKSGAWSFFQKLDGKRANNLWKHLEVYHGIEQLKKKPQNASERESAISSSKTSNSSKDLDTAKPSSSVTVTISQEDKPDEPLQPTLETLFARRKAYDEDGQRFKELLEGLLFMVCKDNLCLSTPEKEGFRHLMKIAAPLWQPPCRKTLTSLMETRYCDISAYIRKSLLRISSVCITMVCWTGRHQTNSFLGMTVHYAEGNEMKSIVLGVEYLTESHTADYLEKKMLELLALWDIEPSKVSLVITDNAANITKACVQAFGKSKHVPCFAHTINLIPANALGFKQVNSQPVPYVPMYSRHNSRIKKYSYAFSP
ncbi:uncharacterized protein LOC129716867 [Wyeomyia smithii]|uniref:uncharacterized protein LOC129716867 n=1 Tax=Wyeomyia smithii TaxID=174621 RepID=UPI002467D467|nr:uncharacterized protein LOC129716867 [Wyeomyia smithii]